MQTIARLTLIVVTAGILSGCESPTPSPPPANVLDQGMVESLMDTGFYSEVAMTRTIGRHYNPSGRAWRVYACFQFLLINDQQGATCVDSFQAFKLDNGTWVVAVTIDGVYRWRAISIAGESQGNPDSVNVANPG